MSDLLEIPTLFDGTTAYSQRTPLDGVGYIFEFQWLARAETWTFNMYIDDDDQTPVTSGQTITCMLDLLRSKTNGPPGFLFALPMNFSKGLGRPGLLELGDRVRLIYTSEL